MRIITRTVWVLSIVSLLTDVASEMLYPVMPLYLKSINFSILLIGVLEGVAEATAGLSKGYFGKLSDNMGKRLPFVQWGYFLSAISKPMMAVLTYPWWVFTARATDRLGKGIRTGARDALLSDEATPETKARVFGLHRGMDTLGAVTGPALALAYLYFYPESYKTLFFLAFIPAILGIGFTFLVKEKKKEPRVNRTKTSFFDFIRYFRESPIAYRRLVMGLLLFALINSSDIFLLLKIKESGASDVTTIGSYIFYNLIYALLSYPLGVLADKIGVKKVFVGGLVLFAGVYFLMGIGSSAYVFVIAFVLYGIYAAATEGIAKAWISNMVNKQDTATAIGTYTGFQSLCTLLASSLTGLLWFKFGGMVALVAIAGVSLLVTTYMIFGTYGPEKVRPLNS
jgi:MFS family permease